MELLWDYYITDMCFDATQQPLVITEKMQNSNAVREKTIEIFIEKLSVPAFFTASDVYFSSQCDIYNQNAMVVKTGYQVTQYVPFFQGKNIYFYYFRFLFYYIFI